MLIRMYICCSLSLSLYIVVEELWVLFWPGRGKPWCLLISFFLLFLLFGALFSVLYPCAIFIDEVVTDENHIKINKYACDRMAGVGILYLDLPFGRW